MHKFLIEHAGSDAASVATNVQSNLKPTVPNQSEVNFVALFDSVNPFTSANETSVGTFYGTWCSLFLALVKCGHIDLSLLSASHTSITNANDSLSRLQGSAKVPQHDNRV